MMAIYSGALYDAMCEFCAWSKGLTNSPPFRSANKHARESGHKVRVRKNEEWQYLPEENHDVKRQTHSARPLVGAAKGRTRKGVGVGDPGRLHT